MNARWAWVTVRKGFVLQHDDRSFQAGELMRVPAADAVRYAINTTPSSPGIGRRIGYGVARWWRLASQAVADVRLARRRTVARRRRAAEAVRRKAAVVRIVRR